MERAARPHSPFPSVFGWCCSAAGRRGQCANFQGKQPVANPAVLELPLAKFRTGARSLRFTRVLGRDWKIAFLFVLPMVLLMAGLIFWPFVSAILMSTTTLNFQTGDIVNVGL